jgi:hypothetical protein
VNLAVFGMHENGAAIAADELDGMIARIEDRRCAHKGAGAGACNESQTGFLVIGQVALHFGQAGARSRLSAPDAWRQSRLSEVNPS